MTRRTPPAGARHGHTAFALHDSLLLRVASDSAGNKERLSHFFLEHFSGNPDQFAAFLRHVHGRLSSRQGRDLARRYLAVLSPLAEHFGMYRLKRRLDTECFALSQPREYAEVRRALQRYEKASEETLKRITRLLRAALSPHHACVIRGRFKEPYSVHLKLREKAYRDVVALHDLFGFRIILASNNERECFEALHALHDRFMPVAGRFKDYVSIPKINGYQSLHTTLRKVLPDLDVAIEVQIRTQFMHDVSQSGLSSHWMYKKKGARPMLTAEQRALLDHVSSLSQFAGRQRHVYCLAGDRLLQLPQGATVADAAETLGLGRTAGRACRVNGAPQGLGHPLADGDAVEFLPAGKVHDTVYPAQTS